MESQHKCNDTTGASTPPTSKRAPRLGRAFTLLDLHRLTFKLDGAETAHDVETAPLDMFRTFVRAVADVKDVDTAPWTLEQRRDFVNALWLFCQQENETFPLEIINGKINVDGPEKLTNRA